MARYVGRVSSTLALALAMIASGCTGDGAPPPEVDQVQQAVATAAFTSTYTGQGAGSTACNTPFAITGQEPTTSGTNPVFLYLIGTGETATNAAATAAVASMASRGFVAATIAYDSATFNNCAGLQGKARCIFNPGSATSAVAALCGRPGADCSKGIVVGGFSQGAVLATQAKNFDARVQAAWGMGDGVRYTTFFNLSSCQANGNHALPASRLRAVVGERDQFVGDGFLGIPPGNVAAVRTQLQSLTGASCAADAFHCLQSSGSGWYIVQNAQAHDGSADHCYMRVSGDCSGSENSLDAGWLSGTEPWSLGANLDWLDGFVTHGVAVPGPEEQRRGSSW